MITVGDVQIEIESVCLIITTGLAVLGALAGVYKYFQVKDRDLKIKILNNVYAPLYMLISRQEIYRKILAESLEVRKYPILEYVNTKQKTVFSEKGIVNEVTQSKAISRESFVEALNKVDIGLASHRLITLLSMYKGAIELEESLDSEDEKQKDIYWRATVAKCDIERDLLKEIIDGYFHIYNHLKLYKTSYEDSWNINNSGFMVINYNLSSDRIKNIEQQVRKDDKERKENSTPPTN